MNWREDVSAETLEWFKVLGCFGPTIVPENRELKGWLGADKFYLTSADLKKLSKACIEAANWLDLRSELEGNQQ